MVDGTRPEGAAEDDPVNHPEPFGSEPFGPDAGDLLIIDDIDGVEYVKRTPLAAVAITASIGDRNKSDLVVVCDDGACFHSQGGAWVELEPVPGTRRATELEADPESLCGSVRPTAGPGYPCQLTEGHELPHVDTTGYRWE